MYTHGTIKVIWFSYPYKGRKTKLLNVYKNIHKVMDLLPILAWHLATSCNILLRKPVTETGILARLTPQFGLG